jgi:actin-related protein
LIEDAHVEEETKEEKVEEEESKVETDSDPDLEYDIVEKVLTDRINSNLFDRELVLNNCIKSFASITALNEENLIDINIQNLLANCTSHAILKYFLQKASIWPIKSKELVLLL